MPFNEGILQFYLLGDSPLPSFESMHRISCGNSHFLAIWNELESSLPSP